MSPRFARRIPVIVIFCAIVSIASVASAQNQVPAQPRYWESEWKFTDFDLKKLADRLELIGIQSPVRLQGKGNVDLKIAVPLTALRDAKAYRISGTLGGTDVRIGDADFDSLSVRLQYASGILRINELAAKQRDGLIRGSVDADLVPLGDFSAQLTAESFDIGPVVALLEPAGVTSTLPEITGRLSADVKAVGRVVTLDNPAKWDIDGSAQLVDIQVTRETEPPTLPIDVSVEQFAIQSGQVTAKNLRLQKSETAEFFVDASGQFHLQGQGPFEFELRGNDLPIEEFIGFFSANPAQICSGKWDCIGRLKGEFVADNWMPQFQADLAVASPQTSLLGIELGVIEHDLRLDNQRLEIQPRGSGDETNHQIVKSISADYQINDQFIELSNLDADVFAGNFTGDLRLRLDGQQQHTAKLTWAELAPVFHVPSPFAQRQVEVSLATHGTIDWSVEADSFQLPSAHQGTAEIHVQQIKLAGQPVGDLDAKASIDEGNLRLEAAGRLFDGQLSVRSESTLLASTTWQQILLQVLASKPSFRNVSLSRALPPWGGSSSGLEARLAGELQYQPSDTTSSLEQTIADLSLELQADRFEINGRPISGRMESLLNVRDREIRFRRLDGSFSGGEIQASGSWALENGQRLISGRISRLDPMPISEVLLKTKWRSPSQALLAGRINSIFVISGRAGFSSSLRISGSASIAKGTSFGIPIGQVHTPIVATVSTSPFRWQLELPRIRTDLAGGRVSGSAHLRSSSIGWFTLNSRWRVEHVDFQRLLAAYGTTQSVGRGDLTGQMTLNGDSIRDVRDLQGNLQVRLGGTDATAVPGFSPASSLLGVGGLTGVRFENGVAKARFSRGALQLDELKLTSPRAQAVASGRVALTDGRFDVKAAISTGNFQAQNAILVSVGAEAIRNTIPLARINALASNRTIVFDLFGTLRSPEVRLRAEETTRANLQSFVLQNVAGSVILSQLANP